MSKIKIAEFINSLADGGAETLVKDYAKMIDPSRFEVVILTLSNNEGSAIAKALVENKVKIFPVYKKWNILTRVIHRIAGRFITNRFLRRVLEVENPNVIHAHLQTLVYLADIIDCLENRKLLYTCHNLPDHIFGGKGDIKFKSAKKLIIQSGLRMIALHEDMATEINHMFGVSNTAVIKNGINYRRFLNVPRSKNEIRKDLGIDQNAFVIGHVGRFTPQKNHDAILSIFETYRSRNDKAFLLLVGQGELKDQFDNEIKRRKLDKFVLILSNRSDIPEINKAMDVFLFPSRWEGFGIALIEAQVSGIPCIASDVVPKATQISNHVIYESLDASLSQWCDDIDAIVKQDINISTINHEYDMANEIKKLEKLYEI